jgi:hypothetical protein
MERFYFKFLRTPEGERLEYERVGSVGKGPYGGILDWYKVRTKDGKKTWDIYIDMYHSDVETIPDEAPPGLITLKQYTALTLKGKRKEYINLWLPSGSNFVPIAELYKGQLIVARVTHTDYGRDITVLRQEGEGWHPFGDKGKALVGSQKGYAFLGDMRLGPDNTLWVSSIFTFPYRMYFYRLDSGKWKIAGPEVGYRPRSGVNWDSGILFLGDNRPCLIMETYKEGIHVLRLEDIGWTVAPITNKIKGMIGKSKLWSKHISRRDRDTWMVWKSDVESFNKSEVGNFSTLRAACLIGHGESDLKGPYDLMSFRTDLNVEAVAVSPKGVIATNLRYGILQRSHVHLFTPRKDGGFDESKCSAEGLDSGFEDMIWGPDHTLFALRKVDCNALELLKLKEREWITIDRHVQPEGEGRIGFARIFFKPTGKPFVIWADWFR